MTTFSIWNKLAKSKKYREEYVAAFLKRSVPFQIRALLKKRGWSQEKLARESGLTQGVISRAQDSDYGNLTFNTVVRIAAGFDCAFVGRFVPFSELAKYDKSISEESIVVPSFNEDLGFVDDSKESIQTIDFMGRGLSAGSNAAEGALINKKRPQSSGPADNSGQQIKTPNLAMVG